MSLVSHRRLGPRTQRGVAGIMAMLFLIVVVAFSAVTLLNMATSDLHDSTAQNDGVAALFLAESGIERASQLYASGIACGAGLLPVAPIALGGRGTFQSAGVTPSMAVGPTRCQVEIQGVVGATTRKIQGDLGRGTITPLPVSTANGNSSVIQWTHTIPGTAGGNRIVIVGITMRGTATINVANPGTYAGQALTRITPAALPNGNLRVEWLYQKNPPTGPRQVRVNLVGGTNRYVGGAFAFSGVDQITPFDIPVQSSQANSASALLTVTPATDNSWVIDLIAAQLNTTVTVGALQSLQWGTPTPGGPGSGLYGGGSRRGPISPASPVPMSWGLNPVNNWVHSVLVLRPMLRVVRWTEK